MISDLLRLHVGCQAWYRMTALFLKLDIVAVTLG